MTRELTVVTSPEMLGFAFDEMLHDPRPGFQVDSYQVSLEETIGFLHARMREFDPGFNLVPDSAQSTEQMPDQGNHIDNELLDVPPTEFGSGLVVHDNISGEGDVTMRLGRTGLVYERRTGLEWLDYRGKAYKGKLGPGRLTVMSEGIYWPDKEIGPAFHNYRTSKGGIRTYRRWTDERIA